MNFEQAIKKFLSMGIGESLARYTLETICKTGRSIDFTARIEKFRIHVLYSGEKRDDMNFWGLSTDNYTFDIWRV